MGQRIIDKKGATTEVAPLLDRGGTVGFIADQNAGSKGIFVDFFGRKASTYKSIGLLAMEYEVPVVIGYARRVDGRFRFRVGVQDIIYPDDWKDQDDPLRYITQRYTKGDRGLRARRPGAIPVGPPPLEDAAEGGGAGGVRLVRPGVDGQSHVGARPASPHVGATPASPGARTKPAPPCRGDACVARGVGSGISRRGDACVARRKGEACRAHVGPTPVPPAAWRRESRVGATFASPGSWHMVRQSGCPDLGSINRSGRYGDGQVRRNGSLERNRFKAYPTAEINDCR